MKNHVIVTVLAIAAHLGLTILSPPYFRLLADCGAMVSHGNDVADVPRQGLLGSMIVGLVWIAVANGFVAWWRLGAPLHD